MSIEIITIIGQGLAGSLLGYELIQRGFDIEIIDPAVDATSSNRAAGLYNPITGRAMKKTWLAENLFPGLETYYRELEKVLNIRFLHSIPVYRPFFSNEEQNDWEAKGRLSEYQDFIKEVRTKTQGIPDLQDPYGGLVLRNTGFLDLPIMIKGFRHFFRSKGVLKNAISNHEESELAIYCDGPFATENKIWNFLPFKPVHGEIIDIECTLPTNQVYNRGVFMIPKNGIFRVGSTYDHDNLTFEPQEKGVQELETRLSKLFNGKYEIKGVSAGVRPATYDRRPFIGWHPENKGVGIFNGFGTKGVSLVPYFSKLFVDSIEGKAKIHSEADVSRVYEA